MSLAQLTAALSDMEVVELGQYLEEGMPTHPSHSRFFKMRWHGIALGDVCNDYQLLLNEHNGTHIDSFGHFINKEGFEFIDQIAVESLCGVCVTMDATFLKPRESLEKEHIVAWEQTHGAIAPGTIFLVDFGWMQYWDLKPNNQRFCHDFPGVGASGAAYLLEKQVALVGVDTLGVDTDGAPGNPAHNLLLGNRIPVVENLRNLGKLHDKQGYFLCLPLLIREGTASPVRPVVLIDRS